MEKTNMRNLLVELQEELTDEEWTELCSVIYEFIQLETDYMPMSVTF